MSSRKNLNVKDEGILAIYTRDISTVQNSQIRGSKYTWALYFNGIMRCHLIYFMNIECKLPHLF